MNSTHRKYERFACTIRIGLKYLSTSKKHPNQLAMGNLHCKLSIRDLHCKLVIGGLHCKLPMGGLHCKVSMGGLCCKLAMGGLHCKLAMGRFTFVNWQWVVYIVNWP